MRMQKIEVYYWMEGRFRSLQALKFDSWTFLCKLLLFCFMIRVYSERTKERYTAFRARPLVEERIQ